LTDNLHAVLIDPFWGKASGRFSQAMGCIAVWTAFCC
jgi:hypothetical protein